MTLLSIPTRQVPLIPLPPPQTPSAATAQIMRMLLEAGAPPHTLAGLLAAAGFSPALVRYLRGPVILPDSPWVDTLPAWLTPAIYVDRLSAILAEHARGIAGDLATPVEVLAYLYPHTPDATLPEEWQRLYLWAGQETLPRHSQMSRDAFLRDMNGGEPVFLSPHDRRMLRRMQFDLRRKVVTAAIEAEYVPPALPAPGLFPPSMQDIFVEVPR